MKGKIPPFIPDSAKNVTGKFIALPKGEILTNIQDRDFTYLLSLAGFHGVSGASTSAAPCLTVGNAPNDIACAEGESVLVIDEASVGIYGFDADAVSTGLKILLSLLSDGLLPEGEFRYKAKVKMRAVHFCIFKPNDGTDKESTTVDDLLRRLKIAALCGYNYAFIEFWGMFPYEKHPYAHWENCWSKEDVKALIDFAIDDLHIIPIPVQNLTSHAGWSRISSRQHVVLDRRPDLADMWIPGGWCFATRNEATKAYLRDAVEELVTAFRNPPFLHCSCDKCFGFGSAEEERVIPADLLFEEHIKFLHDELAAYGTRMVMWSDMIYSSLDVKYWKCDSSIADRLNRDILMNIWTHNDIGSDEWQDIGFFESRGYETIYSPFLDKKGAKNMVEQCISHGSLGVLQTTWHRPETALSTVVYTGLYMWGHEPSDEQIKQILA